MGKFLQLILAACLSTSLLADDVRKAAPPKIEAFTSADKAGPDFAIQGEYRDEDTAAQVIALGDGKFEILLLFSGLPGDGEREKAQRRIKASRLDGKVPFEFGTFKCVIADDRLTLNHPGSTTTLKRVVRTSPALGMKPPAGAVVLFDGTSAAHWDGGKLVEDSLLKWGTTSKENFGDCTIHLEFRLPFMPRARGQGRANSGVYVQSRYEVQILDSFGLEGKNNECGGIYTVSAPKINMCFPPLSWQTYDIDFVAARFDASGKKTAPARMTVRHNGVMVQDNIAIPGPTPGSLAKESSGPGPIHLQDHGDPVVFRNIWVLPKK